MVLLVLILRMLITWITMAPMMLGILEVVAHLGAIKMFNLKRFYSPGLVTSVVVLLPISIYTIVYAAQQVNIKHHLKWDTSAMKCPICMTVLKHKFSTAPLFKFRINIKL